MRRITILFTALLFAMSMLATSAAADHPHNLNYPNGCADIPVDVPGQDHEGYDDYGHVGNGKKFHGAAHVGAAVDEDNFLGQGNSPVWVGGGPC